MDAQHAEAAHHHQRHAEERDTVAGGNRSAGLIIKAVVQACRSHRYKYHITRCDSILFDLNSIIDIAVALIQARMARNWTQKQLGKKLKLPEQHIQRYESTRYKGVAVERLQEVADALNVRVQEVVTIEQR